LWIDRKVSIILNLIIKIGFDEHIKAIELKSSLLSVSIEYEMKFFFEMLIETSACYAIMFIKKESQKRIRYTILVGIKTRLKHVLCSGINICFSNLVLYLIEIVYRRQE
jgi:hypothetical protein